MGVDYLPPLPIVVVVGTQAGRQMGRQTTHTHTRTYKYRDQHKKHRHTDTQHTQPHNIHRCAHTHTHTRCLGDLMKGGPRLKSACVTEVLCLSVFLCRSVAGDVGSLCMSLVLVLRVCACVPTTIIYPQTQSFLFLVSRGSGRRESRQRPEGGGQGRSSAPLPRRQFPAKVRCPPATPAAWGRDMTAPGRPTARGGREPGFCPGTWHVGTRQGHCTGAPAAH